MASYMRGEMLKVLFGGDQRLLSTMHSARRIDEKYIPPSLSGNRKQYTPEEWKKESVVCERLLILRNYWYFQCREKCSKALSAKRCGYHRDTLREWEKRYYREGWRGLIPLSRARKTLPERTARTPKMMACIKDLRQKYNDGRDIIVEWLARAGIFVSASSVGRGIRELKEAGEIPTLVNGVRLGQKTKRSRRPYAERRKGKVSVRTVGSVQMDTKHMVIPRTGFTCKIFGVRDVFSNAVYYMAASNGTAPSAARGLSFCEEQAGYSFTEVQTDNGSEFRAEFEQQCQQMGKQQFLIPIRSPKWNSKIEGSFKYLDDNLLNADNSIVPSIADVQAKLDAFVRRYNNKPNSGLSYICPVSGRKRLRTPNEVRDEALSGRQQ